MLYVLSRYYLHNLLADLESESENGKLVYVCCLLDKLLMAPSSLDVEHTPIHQDNWGPRDDQEMGPGVAVDPGNAASLPTEDDHHPAVQGSDNPEYPGGSGINAVSVSDKGDTFREKQVKVLRSLLVCSVLPWCPSPLQLWTPRGRARILLSCLHHDSQPALDFLVALRGLHSGLRLMTTSSAVFLVRVSG